MAYQTRQSETFDVVRLMAGILFLCSAAFRMFHRSDGAAEMMRLHLPPWFSIGVIVFDLAVAAMFLLDIRVRTAAAIAIVFFLLSILLGLWFYWKSIVDRLAEMFVFTPNSTGLWLQFMYILLLAILYREAKRWS
ncbi:MAG: DoxX family membrane protein [Bryobacteraceae bacterium]|jgi:uncharacterized membrane protein YphA (DoxX/SURF4 family)